MASDPEGRTTQSGVHTCSFRLAVQRSYKNASGGYDADFLPVVAWRQTADFCTQYLTKGRKVAVSGSIQVRDYTAQDGGKRYVTEIIADSVEALTPAHAQGDGQPAELMAHYDVVPVNEEGWDVDPFAAVVKDGVMWGRGTLDTKVTFNAILFSVNKLIADGFTPENDVYLAFSGGEEVHGIGAARIVDYFEENGITPAFVMDEGGAVVENVFPGVKKPCALIGVAEKGFINLELTTKSNGGHASAPKPHTPVGVLSQACVRLENKPFKFHITPPVKAMFDKLGRESTFVYRLIFANLWCFAPVLDMICRKSGGDLNALMRTTVAFTQMEGSSAANVIPPKASMVANMRLNPYDTVDSAIEYVKKVIDDDSIKVKAIESNNPSRLSVANTEGFAKIEDAIKATWKCDLVSPYLMVQCSDSYHWGRISDRVYRFSAMDLTSDERKTIHGHNERIRLDCLNRSVEFYLRLIASI